MMTVTSHARNESTTKDKPPIADPYALFACVRIEIDEQGRRWTDGQWAKDLALHLDYIDDLTLVSPATRRISANLVSLDEPPFDRLKFIDLPCPISAWQALKDLPRCVLQDWRAVSAARIVHTGFAGWPFANAWIAVPLAKIRRKFVVANVESSIRFASVDGLPWHKTVRNHLFEYLTRYCLRMADLRLFTSKAYLQELLPPNSPRAYVTPATWLNDEWILGAEEADASWATKEGPVRLLFASRLIAEKGVGVLLSAIEKAAAAGANVQVSIIGTGPMLDDCIAFAKSDIAKKCVQILEPVTYGEPFLSLLRGFDVALVPSLSDEQPRILYDAFSQAVPVIGSATGGIIEIVQSEVTGHLSAPGDATSLAQAMIWAGQNRAELRAMGLRALESVRGSTHLAMHQKRHGILLEALGKR
jgi:glycosyltransferase involved in cell wall biosynthesis